MLSARLANVNGRARAQPQTQLFHRYSPIKDSNRMMMTRVMSATAIAQPLFSLVGEGAVRGVKVFACRLGRGDNRVDGGSNITEGGSESEGGGDRTESRKNERGGIPWVHIKIGTRSPTQPNTQLQPP